MRKMKASGVEWIDVIPEDWSIVPLKTAVSFGKGLPITKANLVENGVAVVSYGQIHSKSNIGSQLKDELVRYVSEDYLTSNPDCLAKKGDIFVADTSEDYEGIGNSVLIDWDRDVFAGYHTVIISPSNRMYSKYLSYLFMTDAWRSQLRSRASGIKVFSITQALLKKSAIIVPNEDCIQRITDYLDEKCSKIDAIIARQEEIIEKLKEYKLSIITEAVTKGIRPNVEMKDTGNRWIAKMPIHYKLRRLKYMCSKISDGTHFSPETAEEGYPYITAGDVHGKGLDYKNAKKVNQDDYFELVKQGCRPQKGDVLIVKDGATTGRVGLMEDNQECVILSSVAMLHPSNDVESEYLMYVMMSHEMQQQIILSMAGAAMPRTTLTKLMKYICVYAPFEEQREIVNYLNSKVDAIDFQIGKRTAALEKFREYKKSLIYEVVTGKKEV